MAIRFAKQAGNWSDPNTWDGGLTLPQAGDDVYLNGFNITVDQDVTVLSISNSPTPIGVTLSIIPDMTGNTTPTGVGQAFADQNNANAWLSFRKPAGMPNTVGWGANSRPAAIGYLYNTSKIIKRYAWRQNSDTNRRPRDWTFEGSNDGSTWVVLDTVTGSSVSTYYSSVLANTTPYTYYRINVSTSNGTNAAPSFDYIDMTESNSLGNGYGVGGTATISTSRTVNAELYHNTGTLITISATSPSVVNINGNMPGTIANSYSRGIVFTNNATLNYVGNIKGADISRVNAQDCKAIILATGASINLTGDIFAGTNTSTSTTGSENIGITSANGATINVVGNLDGGVGARNRAIGGSTNDTITVTGNVYGGNGSTLGSQNGIVVGSTTISCNIVGNVSSGPNSYGIISTSATPVIITGNLQNYSNGLMAVSLPYLFLNSTNMQWEFRKSDLTTNTLYTPGVATGFPATNNVRTGITYGPTNNLTGTCAVPPANAVSVGVPVDNTVGTANVDTNALAIALTASLSASLPTPIATALDTSLSASLPTPISASLQASLPTPIATALDTSLSASLPAAIAPLLWDEDVANITTPNSIGERLKNCATVATTGAQISSFNP